MAPSRARATLALPRVPTALTVRPRTETLTLPVKPPGPTPLVLGPLDLQLHGTEAIALARDMFRESYGSPERFEAECGADGSGFLMQLRERQTRDARNVVGAVDDGRLQGLLVLGHLPGPPPSGHLVLLAVNPEWRGTGLAKEVLDLAIRTFQAQGWSRARLHVTERNARARRFYAREGWTDLGEHPFVTGICVFERLLDSLH
jgi:ribosomal protein S18 acetylase RimI-like enzyme